MSFPVRKTLEPEVEKPGEIIADETPPTTTNLDKVNGAELSGLGETSTTTTTFCNCENGGRCVSNARGGFNCR